MKISIITPTLNCAATLGDTLRSLAEQTHRDFEHIVVDGGSTDGTRELLQAHDSQIGKVITDREPGLWHAMNIGLQAATGDVIAFLNADDFYTHNRVLEQVAKIFADRNVDACYADLIYVSREDTSKTIRYWRSRHFEPGLFRRGWMPAHPTFFVRSRVYRELGGFDEKFKRQADFDLTMRFLEVHRIRAKYVNDIWVTMRMGGVSNARWRDVLRGNIEAYRIANSNGLKVGPAFIAVKMLSRLSQFVNRPRAG